VAGPSGSLTIDITFSNEALSTSDIVEIVLNGVLPSSPDVLWDDTGLVIDPPGADSTIAGEGTNVLTVTFTDNFSGFNPDELFRMFGVKPLSDPGGSALTVADLVGVGVEFTFEDTSRMIGTLELENPGNAASGLHFVLVPEPATAILLVCGLTGLALGGRVRRP
jgi:hypothetical protein